jgi:hypothetical protein
LTQEKSAELNLPEGFILIGYGTGVMDEHYFRRSPGSANDGPVTVREIDGYEFVHCANPPDGGAETPVEGGPRLLKVDKHHSLIFLPGREVDVLCLPEGSEYIQVIAASPEGGGIMQQASVASSEMVLPDGWKKRQVKFQTRTTIHLPNPTKAWFFSDGTSYQGPIDLEV